MSYQQPEKSSGQPLKQTILAVDDAPENLDVIKNILTPKYRIKAALDGITALKLVDNQPPDLILLDILMPKMNGYEVCSALKKDPSTKDIPVVFITVETSPDALAKGLEVGAFYYLTKPVNPKTLKAVVISALLDYASHKALNEETSRTLRSLSSIHEGKFKFQTLSDAHNLALLMANAYPNPSKVVMGLTALFINAVEHGNLGISYEEKSILNKEGNWELEIQHRLTLPENAKKFVTVKFERSEKEIQVLICDQGPGFVWQNYMEFNLQRALDNHGRGIFIANKISFDQLEYQGTGNEVLATVKISK